MPAERTEKKPLHQTTLFGFTKSSAVSRPPRAASPSSPSDELPPPKRVQSAPKPTKPKAKSKLKAGDENRVSTDAILSIKPEFTKLIAARKKNHEYRKYKLETVTRFWLYETAPTSAITYLMFTTTPKVPGEVNDPSGVGNDDFDRGLKQSKYGYPVTELYKLRKPLTTAELKSRFDIAVPQGWRYATKQLVNEMKLEDMEKIF
ncbi:hypothetical protein L226DRAFT_467591 [Lentinus tigrinus ALCF2SS1-7]|uniref:Uncharacterized protein n=1 Tax=Lentinus tigrinus ALCF2SS1-6 TaxID=1328759 RepID=A0A5C2S3L2_9APHY|nr:hypothetical protein L227DRAFT_530503 [Lentinus tigrinus ALCF2SS1-6]RPD72112.1 hypothetical protein L226DRAFT_467591 [Lentinus tigrinus ALCF2SS1-7]